MTFFKTFARDERGATAIEYALLAALIGVGIIGGATLLGQKLNATYETIGDTTEANISPIADAQ